MDYDYIIVGSGFGGSVCGLRLVEKGYRVLMLEQGREWNDRDFPRTNWHARRYLWSPRMGLRGILRLSFLRHVTVLSGVGVGGGSLVYAATHPVPKAGFFTAPSWAHLAQWQRELAPHYNTAKHMLGVTRTPFMTPPDHTLQAIANARGRAADFDATEVAIYFGNNNNPPTPGNDPYFSGEGPARAPCIRCGGCMLGCRHNAKNTLPKNYLYLARKRGLHVRAQARVRAVLPRDDGGYAVHAKIAGTNQAFTARNVILAGGVLGSVELLLRMQARADGLPHLSPTLGAGVRTNSEALLGIIVPGTREDLSKGIAIGSILQTGEHAHLEPVRFPAGSGFFRLLSAPHVSGTTPLRRILALARICMRHPIRILRAMLVRDFARATTILLYMQSTEGTLRLKLRRWFSGLTTVPDQGPLPTANMPEVTELAHDVARRMGGEAFSLVTDTFLNIPTTAHILGGCCMGQSRNDGVIDAHHEVFGYRGLYVIDGSSVSANPGVNPSLTIAALAERAMAAVPHRQPAENSSLRNEAENN